MHLALIVDPLDQLKPAKDSSIAIWRAAAARGHRISAIAAGTLALVDGRIRAQGCQLRMRPRGEPCWYEAGPLERVGLSSFDAVVMRQDPPFDLEYLYSTHLLEIAEGQGVPVYNRPRALRDHNEKLAATRFPHFTPATVVSRDADLLRDFLAIHRDVILKPLDGMGGSSIFRVRPDDPNLSVILETMTRNGSETVMAQAYLPAIVAGDKRVLVVDGEPAPFALARIPAAGETRGNLAAGGRGVAQPLTARDREIALAVGAYAREHGLLLVGLDIIGDHLTEINVTSPTCMVEIFDQTGHDVAERVIAAIERQSPGGRAG
jgi:glutathione synthase